MELLASFHGGDPALRDGLYRMREDNAEEVARAGGPSDELIADVRRANAARD